MYVIFVMKCQSVFFRCISKPILIFENSVDLIKVQGHYNFRIFYLLMEDYRLVRVTWFCPSMV